MKFNWGTGIAIFYTIFVLFTGFMVYKAFGEDFDLVTEDYYAQEIKFQDKIDSRSRAEALDASLQNIVEGENLKIIFPQQAEALTGSINCFRPSDETKDFIESFKTETGSHTIPLSKFIKGKYLIKVDWSANGVDYYQEQTIVIP